VKGTSFEAPHSVPSCQDHTKSTEAVDPVDVPLWFESSPVAGASMKKRLARCYFLVP
jgi:hypothetical protein